MTDVNAPTTVDTEIKTAKVNVHKMFTDFWFRIPVYQRSYRWGEEQIDELLDDLTYSLNKDREKEYFLGSAVLQRHKVTSGNVMFTCYDLLDGQQRLTTLFLMMAVLRDITTNDKLRTNTREAIYQQEDPFSNQPERVRIEFLIRDEVEDFIAEFIKPDGGTKHTDKLKQQAEVKNESLSNMAKSVLYMKKQLGAMTEQELSQFAIYLFNKVIFIYVASENLEDAFRLFMILNDRGIPLSTSDILKSMNVGEVPDEKSKQKYARMWEDLEGEFGRDEFERFLNHIRTIIVKEKPRENLLKEYEKIYAEKKLHKGEPSLKLVKAYREHFAKLIWQEDDEAPQGYALKNLITVMNAGLATDWIPPLLFFYERFGNERLLEFSQRLESKFAADWICQLTPTTRISNTNAILREIENASTTKDVVEHEGVFSYDRDELRQRLSGDIYGKNFCKYVLLKLECLLRSSDQGFPAFTRVSVEHVLPQNPAGNSQWRTDFTDKQREEWTHRLANLVLLTRNKNSSLNNRDFAKKKSRYFASSIDVFPNIALVMQCGEWTPDTLEERQENHLDRLLKGFK